MRRGTKGTTTRVVRGLAAVGLTAATLGAAACGDEGNDQAPASGGDTATTARDKPVRVAYFTQFINDYLQAEYEGIKKGLEATPGSSVQLFDAKGDPTKQVNQIQDAVTSGRYDGFIVNPLDNAAVAAPVRAAARKGIRTVATFSPIGKELLNYRPQVDGVVSVVFQDTKRNGTQLGDLVVEACESKDPCRVAYIAGLLNTPYEKIRVDAFKARLKSASNVDLVSVQDGQYLPDKALAVTQNILQANASLDVLASSGDNMVIGAEQAVRRAGREGKIALISNGAGKKAISAIKSGRWASAPVFTPFSSGKAAAEALVEALTGGSPEPSIDGASLSTIGPIATRANVGAFKGEY